MSVIRTGLDRVVREWPARLRGLRVGLVAHPASVDRRLMHAVSLFEDGRAARLVAIYGPQHGWLGEAQDNMIEAIDPKTTKAVRHYRLYGRLREPTEEMLRGVDVVVVDLQDVGTRVYTFIQTLYLVMKSCARWGNPVVILDRPNPIGGRIEGPMLHPAYRSFVGLTSIPLRHGLTIGEMARQYQMELRGDLTVIPMIGWRRSMYFEETRLPWVMPSPNMPGVETSVVYPGTVLLEGTSLSEGRGTTRPFEIVGSPGVQAPEKLAREIESYRLSGVRFRPMVFKPTFNKHAGKICGGVQIHVTDRSVYQASLTGAAILKAFRRLDRGFQWKRPPYEYEYKKYPIDILSGSDRLRTQIDRDDPVRAYRDWFESDAAAFRRERPEVMYGA